MVRCKKDLDGQADLDFFSYVIRTLLMAGHFSMACCIIFQGLNGSSIKKQIFQFVSEIYFHNLFPNTKYVNFIFRLKVRYHKKD